MSAVSPPAWDTSYEQAEAAIANLALARIGANLIADTTEDTPSSRQARAIFAATRDELLRDYEFNFAKASQTLSEDAVFAYKGSWSYAFTVPTSPVILKILSISGNTDNLYEVVGSGANRRLLANVTTTTGPNVLQVQYVAQVIDPSTWDSLFKDALVLRLASKLAMPLVKRADLAQVIQQEFAAIFTLAKTASSQERQLDESEPLWTDRAAVRK